MFLKSSALDLVNSETAADTTVPRLPPGPNLVFKNFFLLFPHRGRFDERNKKESEHWDSHRMEHMGYEYEACLFLTLS